MSYILRRTSLFLFVALSLTGALSARAPTVATAQPAEPRAITQHQRELLELVLGRLKASSVQPQVYFVGFAGYGREAVFKREVLAVRQLFDDRFGTRDRSVALINHPSTINDIPLASASNLETVLQRIGKLITRRGDTLFLFLSSHGVENRLIVEMPGFVLRPLTPPQLKSMLDRSGIERRVIVLSSCHSGSFIPALADANTLVITASRADRSSFGCADKRRWTYFGDAYFNRALREETSFRRAFGRAKKLIAIWEARDQLTPSLPQISGGEALNDDN
jgi:hypothetical protein